MSQKLHYKSLTLDADLIVPDYEEFCDSDYENNVDITHDFFTDEIVTERLDIAVNVLRFFNGGALLRKELRADNYTAFGGSSVYPPNPPSGFEIREQWVVPAPERSFFHVRYNHKRIPWILKSITKPFMFDLSDSDDDIVLMKGLDYFPCYDYCNEPNATPDEILNRFSFGNEGQSGVINRPVKSLMETNELLKKHGLRVLKIDNRCAAIVENDGGLSVSVIFVNSGEATHYFEIGPWYTRSKGLVEKYLYRDF